MSSFEDKFKHLNFDKIDLKKKNNSERDDKFKNERTRSKEFDSDKDDEKNEDNDFSFGAAQEIFKELVKNIAKSTQQDKMFILFLITMLKNKKASNELILALLYIFL